MAKILLTGGRAPATLHVLRLLHQNGHEMYQADSLPFALAGASRYCRASLRLPPPAFDLPGFARVLGEFIQKNNIDLLIPTCEEVFYLAQIAGQLPAPVFAPPVETLRLLHSKWLFNQALRDWGLPAVETRLFDEKNKADDAPEGFPAVVKAEYTRFGTSVRVLKNPFEWHQYVAHQSGKGAWIWQRYLQGQHWGTYSIAKEGRVVAHTAYPLRWRYGAQGAATFFEATPQPEIARQIQVMVSALRYTGQIAFDFIQNEADGQFYAIECNPRLTSGVHLFAPADGIDRAFLHGETAAKPSGPPGCLGLPMWMAAGRKVLTADFWRDRLRAQEAVWDIRDPGPTFAQLPLMAYWAQLALRKGIGLTEATTWGIAWDGGFTNQ